MEVGKVTLGVKTDGMPIGLRKPEETIINTSFCKVAPKDVTPPQQKVIVEPLPNIDQFNITAKKGLWLSKIAMIYDVHDKPVSLDKVSKALADFNGIKDPNKIKENEIIQIPKTLSIDGKEYSFSSNALPDELAKTIDDNRTFISEKQHKKIKHHKMIKKNSAVQKPVAAVIDKTKFPAFSQTVTPKDTTEKPVNYNSLFSFPI